MSFLLKTSGLLGAACLWASAGAVAQTGAVAPVRGQVTDAATTQPLPGAVVRWLGTTQATSADERGAFSLVRLAQPGAARLVVSFLGYRPDTVLVAPDATAFLRLGLRRGTELTGVRVEGRAQAYSALTPTNTQVISRQDLTKSACCNLAESFETNAAVEVSTTDAVSGAKQIQLLGLDGAYSLLTVDNQPALRGLAAPYRLGYLAGPWIESIDIIKGTGSVVNGYESIAGQVNVRLKEPDKADRLLFNAYGNDLGKFDLNLNLAHPLTSKLSTLLLLHTDHLGHRVDRNQDGFLDLPLATQYNVLNKWKYNSGHGITSEAGLGVLVETRQGGQLNFRSDAPGPYYGTTQHTNRYTGFGKVAYTWPGRPYQSLGLLLNGTSHAFRSAYGRNTYDGTQRTGQATLLFQSVLGTTAHTYRLGLSYLHDNYAEQYYADRVAPTETPAQRAARENPRRQERVPGAFAEYTYQNAKNLTLVSGLRLDYHNLYGWLLTPRLHLKYDVTPATMLRLSVGRGTRVANPLAENTGMLVSARAFVVEPDLAPEKAWNLGGSFTQYFTVGQRPATFVADYYYTTFQNQVVADMYSAADYLTIGNLQGRSYSHSMQAEVQVEPLKGLQAKAAYKLLNVQTDYAIGRQPKFLTPRHRLFANLAYATAFDKWRFDLTGQWFGRRPLARSPGPGTGHSHSVEALDYTPRYALFNTQVTRAFKHWELYAGAENLLNYRQKSPIMGADNPFGPNFDAAMVWGPTFGRLTYLGVRWTL